MGSLFSSSPPPKTESVIKAEARQDKELNRLTKKEAAQKYAMKRRRGGRASLMSGSERGITTLLG